MSTPNPMAVDHVQALARDLPVPDDAGDIDEQRAELLAIVETFPLRATGSPLRRVLLVALALGCIATITWGAVRLWPEPRVIIVEAAARPPIVIAAPVPPTPTRPAPTTTPPIAAPPQRIRAAQRLPATHVPSPSELAFQHAMEALQRGNLADATASFERAIDGGGSIVEDARFWLSVTLGRAGSRTAAIRSFEQFLALYPHSARRGSASAMLGWQLVDDGDTNGARRRFRDAVRDPDPSVSESAQSGLDHLDR